MSPLGADSSRPRPSPLLQELEKDEGDVETYWMELIHDWDADFAFDEIRSAVAKCREATRESGVQTATTSIQDQLEELLSYDGLDFSLEPKKILILNAAIKFFEGYNAKSKKAKRIQQQLEITGMIIKTICQVYPTIAFKQCPNERIAFEKTDLQSAFQMATTSGSGDILNIILGSLMEGINRKGLAFFETAKRQDPPLEANSDGKFEFQTVAEKGVAEILESLLYASESLTGDHQNMARCVFMMLSTQNQSLCQAIVGKVVATTSTPDPIRFLLGLKSLGYATEAYATVVVEKGTVTMWNSFPEQVRRAVISTLDIDLLFKIISSGNTDMVAAIYKLEPEFIEMMVKRESYENLLRHLQDFKNSSTNAGIKGTYQFVRDLFVDSMIQIRNLGIQDIRNILQRSGTEAYGMSFHFPHFTSDSKTGTFTDYVRELKMMKADFFRYERTLKYANFPELCDQVLVQSGDHMRQDHREIMDVFDWLRDRGVWRVLSLSVKDRLYCPHIDEDVAACISTFNVRILNWRKLDMYLKHMTNSSVEELHLYSSGNQSVHDQWLEQLPRFQQLKRLFVYVVKDVIKPRLINQITKDLESSLNGLNKTRGYPWTSDRYDSSLNPGSSLKTAPGIKVSQLFWTEKSEVTVTAGQNLGNRTLNSYLAEFVQNLCAYYKDHPETKKTRVALIDSGVVVVRGRNGESSYHDNFSTLAHQIVEGISLVRRDDEESMWWHATEPHGTQMAALICALNPVCDLYVVKVAESDGTGITGYNVAKAIEWARSRKVDVISLSLVTFSDPDQMMSNAIKMAKEDDIVVICSTADEGSIGAHSVGENNENALSIAACDRWGNLLPQSQKAGFDYQFLGHNVYIGQVPYSESLEVIEGSSVSTAIAAGMASLILACTRISTPLLNQDVCKEEGRRRSWRFNAVKNSFDRMSEGKWVILDNLCGSGELRNSYHFERLVKEQFHEYGA